MSPKERALFNDVSASLDALLRDHDLRPSELVVMVLDVLQRKHRSQFDAHVDRWANDVAAARTSAQK